jgi:LacI family transcriptional regulator
MEVATRLSKSNRVATLRDVALVASVDPSVVSRVLRNDPRLSITSETRERVLSAIEELEYRPNAQARGLRLRRTWTIGFVLPDIGNPVYSQIVHGAQAHAEEAGYAIAIGSPLDGRHVEHAFTRLLRERRFDGLLVATSREDESLGALTSGGAPVVVVNRRIAGIASSVVVDDAAGATVASNHLLDLGHSRIAHIAGPPDIDTSVRRQAGFAAAMDARGVDDYVIVAAADYPAHAGYAAALELFENGFDTTGIFVANVLLAFGVVSAARDRGLRVPEDISVVALHDFPIAEFFTPALTTVAMPLAELGAAAVDMLLERIDGKPGRSLMLDVAPRLVVRASTAPLR